MTNRTGSITFNHFLIQSRKESHREETGGSTKIIVADNRDIAGCRLSTAAVLPCPGIIRARASVGLPGPQPRYGALVTHQHDMVPHLQGQLGAALEQLI